MKKDVVFCLYCYLFKPDFGEQGGGDSFVGEGISNWKKKDSLSMHVEHFNSSRNEAMNKYDDLMR